MATKREVDKNIVHDEFFFVSNDHEIGRGRVMRRVKKPQPPSHWVTRPRKTLLFYSPFREKSGGKKCKKHKFFRRNTAIKTKFMDTE